jgi:phosphoglycolate phosphatase-like HAD superfamily hydrolase
MTAIRAFIFDIDGTLVDSNHFTFYVARPARSILASAFTAAFSRNLYFWKALVQTSGRCQKKRPAFPAERFRVARRMR